jgi:hypothetical protein
LVTELFVHGFLIADQMGESIMQKVRKKLMLMGQFIKHNQAENNQLPIMIGDNDSGSLLHNYLGDLTIWYRHLGKHDIPVEQKKYYKDFGISLLHNRDWHVSLRHHAYTKRQPTGHFHHDAGSVTIAYKGVPILVDPGTYVYTASAYWRNYFRSAAVHNTIYQTIDIKNEPLFAISLELVKNNDSFMKAIITMPAGVIERAVIVEDVFVRIIDYCNFNKPQLLTWNFTFASSIHLYQEQGIWFVSAKEYKIRYYSTLVYCAYDAWVSPAYGRIEKTQSLKSAKQITQEYNEHVFVIE